jgi:[histone H3]-lysine4 N-trimethyltransferase MLL1
MDDTGHYYKVLMELKRSKLLPCAGCDLKGATIGCQIVSCRNSYHYACSLNTGWNFRNSRRFFCHKHRKDNFDTEV